MVFDGVVCATDQVLGNVSPFVAHDQVRKVKEPLFLICPLLLLDLRVQVIVPSLAALLTDSAYIMMEVPGRFSAMVVHF